jgi:hypothetical protein
MPSANYAEVLDALREFTARERINFLPAAPDPAPISPYAPIAKYVLDLKNGAKPESAAEDLFTALCKDVLGFQPTRQVGVAEGFVDFMLPERMGDRWLSIVFQHWDTSYFATILESASESGGELKAAITQTGDVIWSMHKKKNSANVLAGEMILTFYKPAKIPKSRKASKAAAPGDAAAILSEVFDACLDNGASSFTSEALFNRLVIELWRRRALGCLNLNREEFAKQLEQRGWS